MLEISCLCKGRVVKKQEKFYATPKRRHSFLCKLLSIKMFHCWQTVEYANGLLTIFNDGR